MGLKILPTGLSIGVVLDERLRGLFKFGDVVIVTSCAAWGIWSIEHVVSVDRGRMVVARDSLDVRDGITIWTFFGNVGVNLTNLTGLLLTRHCCCEGGFVDGDTRMIFVLPIWIFVVGFGTTVWKFNIRGVTNNVDGFIGSVDWFVDVVGWIISCCCCRIGDVCCMEFRNSLAVDESNARSLR